MKRAFFALLAAFCLFVAATAKPPTYDTPGAVHAAALNAYDKKEFATLIECLSDAGVDGYVRFFVLMSQPTTRPAEPKRKELMTKYGLADRTREPKESDDAYMARLAGKVTDKRAFLIALFTQRGGRPKPLPDGQKFELLDLKIEGDSATAQHTLNRPDGTARKQVIRFSRVGGSWHIDTPLVF